MNGKLIALAVGVLPMAAMADVSIYGSIRGGLESNKTYADTASGATIASKSEVNDWTSKIGFKGAEDLGGGLKTIWQVENRVHIDGTGSNDRFATRDAFIGFSGNFGTLRLGRLSDYANSDMDTFDPLFYSGVSVAGVNNIERFDGRHNNAIRYDSPTWDGFNFETMLAVDESRSTVAGDRTNNQFTNLGLSYANSGLFGKYNYGHWGDANKVSSTQDWHRLEVGYNANKLNLVAGFQQVRSYNLSNDYYNSSVVNFASAENKAAFAASTGHNSRMREWILNTSYTIGAWTPSLTYVKGQDVSVEGLGKIENSGYQQWVLGLSYVLSKRTNVIASYGNVKWDDSNISREHSLGFGLNHYF